MTKLTPLREVGEFNLIRHISSKFTLHNSSSLKGIGDDAAIIEPSEQNIVVSTDLLLENIHFDLVFCPLRHLGYKAVAVNVSDMAAMNAIPKQITVGLALGPRYTLEAVEELYEGIKLACEKYGVDLVGGDTTGSKGGLVISITVIGEVAPEQVVRRSTAKPGDLICVTGDLGAAYMGLQLLEREKQAFMADPEMQPELETHAYLVERQLKPEARMDVIYELRDMGVKPTAMIDVSDGLASDLLHICEQSEVGAVIYRDNLPADEELVETALEFNIDPLTCILNGGEDYELLFTIDPSDLPKLKNHPDISVIGAITAAAEGVILATKTGERVPLKAQGWAHF